jgi:glycosyltransferase involved in cell wall biosynthesis
MLVVLYAALFCRKSTTVLFLQKVCEADFYTRVIQGLVRFRNFRIVYDLDDAEYLRNDAQVMEFFMRRAHAVTVGSEALFSYASQFNRRVRVLTTPLPDLNLQADIHFDECVVGWIGDFGECDIEHEHFSPKRALYDLVFPAFLDMAYPVKFVILGVQRESDARDIKLYFRDCPFVKLEIPLDFDWTNEDAIQRKICSFDIGLAPLLNHPFNMAKSAVNLKQYINNGVPVLASPVGEQTKLFEQGEGGFFCDNPADFLNGINAIGLLSKRERLRWRDALMAKREDFQVNGFVGLLLKEIHGE